MANKKHTAKERLEFVNRLLAVQDRLPVKADYIVAEKIGCTIDQARNVRYNRTIDFTILKAYEKIATKK